MPSRQEIMRGLLDPGVVQRGGLLPLGRTKQGKLTPAMPQALVDVMRAGLLPGHAAQGYPFSPEDAAEMSLNITGTGGLLGRGASHSLGMNMWHGGPHQWKPEPGFPQGRPRLDKLGTGEGAQAYGHGFYSAEASGVAKDYRRNLSYKDTVRQFRKDLPDDAEFEDVVGLLGKGHFSGYQEEVIKALDADDWLGFDYPSQAISAAYKELDAYDPSPALRSAIEGSGSLYKMDIPDADVAKYLDWDAPLSKQPEAVKKIFAESNEFYPKYLREAQEIGPIDPSGREIYRGLVQQYGSPEAASGAINKAGIPGLKYHDAMSRGAGEGTRNYVTWDQEVLDRAKILERNSQEIKSGGVSAGLLADKPTQGDLRRRYKGLLGRPDA